jgi:2'-hydroxyisoflavone reductase
VQLLVLGGGGFLGHHMVVAAQAGGHEVTVFSRSEGSEVEGVEVVVGDRHDDLDPLRRLLDQGRSWDAVVDTFTDAAPGAPAVRASAELLSGSVGVYGYVSGMSVYAPSGPAWPDESAPVRRAGVEPTTGADQRRDGAVESPRSPGRRRSAPSDDPLQERSLAKLAGERVLAEVFDGPVLLPRVGIMVGPRDPSRRFTYWPVRLAAALSGRGDRRVLVPGDPERAVQYSDARDVAAWTVGMLAQRRGGVFDVVGPGRRETLAQVLAACLRAAGGGSGDVDPVPVGEDFLRRRLVDVDDEDRPLWYPEDQIPQAGIDSSAALAAGLEFRSAEDTARDVLAEASGGASDSSEHGLDAGAFAAREPALLAEWAAA